MEKRDRVQWISRSISPNQAQQLFFTAHNFFDSNLPSKAPCVELLMFSMFVAATQWRIPNRAKPTTKAVTVLANHESRVSRKRAIVSSAGRE